MNQNSANTRFSDALPSMLMFAEIIGCAIAGIILLLAGASVGFSRGRAFGWYEGYHERERIEQDKRDKLGRFKQSTT